MVKHGTSDQVIIQRVCALRLDVGLNRESCRRLFHLLDRLHLHLLAGDHDLDLTHRGLEERDPVRD